MPLVKGGKPILIVCTSHDVLLDDTTPTGAWCVSAVGVYVLITTPY